VVGKNDYHYDDDDNVPIKKMMMTFPLICGRIMIISRSALPNSDDVPMEKPGVFVDGFSIARARGSTSFSPVQYGSFLK
jgi:hypothetical protein